MIPILAAFPGLVFAAAVLACDLRHARATARAAACADANADTRDLDLAA